MCSIGLRSGEYSGKNNKVCPFGEKRSCVSWRLWNDALSKTITDRSGSLCNKSVLAHSWKTSESIEHSQSETENNFLFSIAPIALIRPFSCQLWCPLHLFPFWLYPCVRGLETANPLSSK